MTLTNPLYQAVSIESRLSKYRLFLYKESSVHHVGAKLRGYPVLFIHGHGGSYRQLRNFASHTTRYFSSLEQRINYPRARTFFPLEEGKYGDEIDFFAADFFEEMPAFHAEQVWEQAEFINDCVRTILNMYKELGITRRSVQILAHSMGGIVARSSFLLQNRVPHSVHTLITLSSPHNFLPIELDPSLDHLYAQVNGFWSREMNDPNSELSHVAIASIAGGFRDTLISSDSSDLSSVPLPPSNALSVLTTTIPGVGVPIDHLCITWCNQFMDVTSRALGQLVRLQSAMDSAAVTTTANGDQHDLWATDLEHRMTILKANLQGFLGVQSLREFQNTWSELMSTKVASKQFEHLGQTEVVNVVRSYLRFSTDRLAQATTFVFENVQESVAKGLDTFALVTSADAGPIGISVFAKTIEGDSIDISGLLHQLPFRPMDVRHMPLQVDKQTARTMMLLTPEDLKDLHTIEIVLQGPIVSDAVFLYAQFEGQHSQERIARVHTFERADKRLAHHVTIDPVCAESPAFHPVAWLRSLPTEDRSFVKDIGFEHPFFVGRGPAPDSGLSFVAKFFFPFSGRPGFEVIAFVDPRCSSHVHSRADMLQSLGLFFRHSLPALMTCLFAGAFLFVSYGIASPTDEQSLGKLRFLVCRVFPKYCLLVALPAVLFHSWGRQGNPFPSLARSIENFFSLDEFSQAVDRALWAIHAPSLENDSGPSHAAAHFRETDSLWWWSALSAFSAFALLCVLSLALSGIVSALTILVRKFCGAARDGNASGRSSGWIRHLLFPLASIVLSLVGVHSAVTTLLLWAYSLVKSAVLHLQHQASFKHEMLLHGNVLLLTLHSALLLPSGIIWVRNVVLTGSSTLFADSFWHLTPLVACGASELLSSLDSQQANQSVSFNFLSIPLRVSAVVLAVVFLHFVSRVAISSLLFYGLLCFSLAKQSHASFTRKQKSS